MLKYHNINGAVYYLERVFEINGAQLKITADENIIGDVTLLSSDGDCFIEVDGRKQRLSKRSQIILHPWSLYHYSGVGVIRTRYLVFLGTNLEVALEDFKRSVCHSSLKGLNGVLEKILQSPYTLKIQNKVQSNEQKLAVAENLKILIDQNYAIGCQLSHLQQSQGFHPTISGRLFKARFKTSPKQYLQRLQVLRSLNSIITTRDPLLHAGFDAGFQDVSRFYKNFSKIVGVSPGRVRRLCASERKLFFPDICVDHSRW